jgi:copper homeostasis protein
MRTPTPLLEVIVTSVRDAVEAELGGASRLEVVRELERGGLTPSPRLVQEIVAAIRIPVRVMVRESDGYTISGPEERDRLCRTARELCGVGVAGLVLGFARGRSVDLMTTMEVLASAAGLRATFHHAFDDLADTVGTLAALKACGRIDCILTRGGEGTAAERGARLRTLAQTAGPEIAVMIGGGVDAAVVRALRREPAIGAFHVGRAARAPASAAGRVSAAKVRALVELLQTEQSPA